MSTRGHGDAPPNLELRAESFVQPVLTVSQHDVTVQDNGGDGGHTKIVRVSHRPRGYNNIFSMAARGRHPNRSEAFRVKCPKHLRNGTHGQNGSNGSDGSYGGGDGSSGSHATAGTNGIPAEDRRFLIGGSTSGITGIAELPNVNLGGTSRNNIMIMAKGGCGGYGGHGGHGGDGGIICYQIFYSIPKP